MPMSPEEYEAIIGDLTNEETSYEDRMNRLHELRADYKTVIEEHATLTELKEKHEKDIAQLRAVNSDLFMKQGLVQEKPEETKQAEFSETVTIESLVQSANTKIGK